MQSDLKPDWFSPQKTAAHVVNPEPTLGFEVPVKPPPRISGATQYARFS